MDYLHLINNGRNYYVYIPATYNIVRTNKLAYTAIQMLQTGSSIDSVCKTCNLSQSEIKRMELFFKNLSYETLPSSVSIPKNSEDGIIIDRITLHVSNDCNLRCKYCYASGGHYNNARGLMSHETAKEFVEFCVREFKQIRNIVFFGGEPFLNPSVIMYVCHMFDIMYKEGKINYLPKFGAITNGTIFSTQIMEIINRYFSFLTISIDGPREINDANRIDVFGAGSYDRITRFIEQVSKNTKLLVQYESTFTEKHKLLGYTHKSIQDFMKETFNLSGDVLDEYSMEKNMFENETSDFTASDILNDNYPEGFLSVLRAVVTKKPKSMCQLYKRNFSVSIEGHIFPCHMNTGEENCDLGSITSGNVFSTPGDFLYKHPGIMYGFKNNVICNNCWANNLCGGCSHLWFYNDTDSNYSEFPNRSICEKNREHIERILEKIGDIKANPTQWLTFKKKFKSAKTISSLNN